MDEQLRSRVEKGIGYRTYWFAQLFATLIINQYAKTHDKGFFLKSAQSTRWQLIDSDGDIDSHEIASLEGMLRLGMPVLWLVPVFYGAIIVFATDTGSLSYLIGSALFVGGGAGWYFTSQVTSNTQVEEGFDE